MVIECNNRLKIRQCLECSKICRGSEWKKHKAEKNHERSWRRLFCSAHPTFKHAHIKSKTFLKKHKGCEKQKTISNASFRQFISDTRREKGDQNNLSPAESDEEATDYETTDDEGTKNTDGENELVLDGITESDSDFEAIEKQRQVFLDKVKAKTTTDTTPPTPQLSSTEAPTVATTTQPPTPQPEKPAGIVRQNKKWDRQSMASKISRESHYKNIYNRFVALEKIHKSVVEENARLKLTTESAKANKEEAEMFKASSREKSLQVANLTAKLELSNSRLEFASKATEDVREELKKIKKNEERLREENERLKNEARRKTIEADIGDSSTLEIHIPLVDGNVSDQILANDLEEDAYDCYEGTAENLKCLHLILQRRGKSIQIRQRIRRKRYPQSNIHEEPTAKRTRQE